MWSQNHPLDDAAKRLVIHIFVKPELQRCLEGSSLMAQCVPIIGRDFGVYVQNAVQGELSGAVRCRCWRSGGPGHHWRWRGAGVGVSQANRSKPLELPGVEVA